MSSSGLNIDVFLYNHFPNDVRPRKEARMLMEEGHRVRVYCLRNKGESKLEVLWGSVEVHRLFDATVVSRIGAISLFRFWIAVLQSWKKRDGRTIIHCHDLSALPPGFIIALIYRFFLIYDSHELFPEAARERHGFIPYFIFYALEVLCCLRVNLLVGVSEPQLRILGHRCRTPMFSMNNYPAVSEIEYRYHESVKSPVVIGMSGFLFRTRGHAEVMDALSLLSREIKLEFWIVGDGPERESLMDKASTLPYPCRFFGFVEPKEDMWDLISNFDYAVIANHPSHNYLVTSVNRPYEYAAIGVPFICPHFAGIKDILEAMKLPKFFPLNITSIRNALRKLMSFNRNQLCSLGRELVEERFCWTRTISKLKKAYKLLK
ncbi:MAG: glycosyltransferase [Candidatus Thorarchaeota archaeon]